jgi:hypothetical protein
MEAQTTFSMDTGIPEELMPLLAHPTRINVCEFATTKSDGTPVTVPLGTFSGEQPRTIAISARLGFPMKAERARRNPKVCLLYSDPDGSPLEEPPLILVYGAATVRDADLQANLDRHVKEQKARNQMLKKMPHFMLRWMSGFLSTIWIEVTPVKIVWWPEANLEKPPQQWVAPAGTSAPLSDPPPEGPVQLHKAVAPPPPDWRTGLADSISRLGTPVLTAVDSDGYPVPFRVLDYSLEAGGARLDLSPAMPAEANGRACLTFHRLQVTNGTMTSNENTAFIGDVATEGRTALFHVERQLPSLNAKLEGLGDMLHTIRVIRASRKRVAIEAARRGQPVPKI